jgi:hypothetical protein
MGNRHPVSLDGEGMRRASGSRHIGWKRHGRRRREWGIHIHPSGRPEESVIEKGWAVRGD